MLIINSILNIVVIGLLIYIIRLIKIRKNFNEKDILSILVKTMYVKKSGFDYVLGGLKEASSEINNYIKRK